ncbi:MAG TPA: tetratricopeptide repeat protein [Trueperaceae bacterium]|nr:tetratricopeptide repeat protein [Trueperaceae bacterium]
MKIMTCNRGVVRTLLASVALLLVLSTALAQSSIADLQAKARANPNDATAWVDLGNAQYKGGSYDDAKQSFLEAISIDYSNGDAHYGLGLAEFARGDYQAALFEFSEVTRLYPGRFDGHFNRAVTLAKLRRNKDAADAFQAALKVSDKVATNKDKINAYTGLAGQLDLTGDYAKAADAYAEAIKLDPGNSDLVLRRGQALENAGKGLEALPELTKLEASSSDYRVSALIADIYVKQGQIDYAMYALNRALKKADAAGDNSAKANILVKLGTLQKSLGRDADAAQSFQQAAQADPESWQALYNLGASYLEGGQTRSALGPLEQAVKLAPQSGEVNLALASAYDQLAQTDKALSAAKIALGNLKDDKQLTQARFIAGRSLYRQGDYSSAANMLDQVVQADSGNAQAQLWAGLAEYQQQQYASAIRYFERATQLAPNGVEARVDLGAAYLAAKRFQDAQTVYELLVKQNPKDSASYYNLGWALYSQDDLGAAGDAWKASCQQGYQQACQAITKYL